MTLIPEDVNQIRAWIAEHDGRINAYWEAQHKLNDKIAEQFSTIHTRITALEKRVMYLAGVASLIGSLVGVLVAAGITG